MPSFTFCGCIPASFPETRDADAVIVGYVRLGGEREFSGPFGEREPEDPDEAAAWFPAPTADWFPSGGPLPKRVADPEPEDGAETAPAPPARPVPAPRPVITPPAAVTPPAGGSEDSAKDDD
jgi:hypothetical protein